MRSWLIWIVVFVASAAVLVLEIVAGRILAPYVGVTLQSFTGIIGTVLAAIAFGAWYGGRLADRSNPESILGPLLFVGLALARVHFGTLDGFRGSGARLGKRGHHVLALGVHVHVRLVVSRRGQLAHVPQRR